MQKPYKALQKKRDSPIKNVQRKTLGTIKTPSLGTPYGSFRKLGYLILGVLIIRILLFRVLY